MNFLIACAVASIGSLLILYITWLGRDGKGGPE